MLAISYFKILLLQQKFQKMHHRLPLISLLLAVCLVDIPRSSCQNSEYDTCARAYQCGAFNFSYPFWAGENRPDYCGYPGFQVRCDNFSIPKITVSSITYRVLDPPNTGDKTVRLARDDLFDSNCAANDGDDTVFNTTMFSYSNTQNLTLLYSCPTLPSSFQGLNQFTCTQNNAPTTNYYILTSQYPSIPNPPAELESCTHNITVPVSRWIPIVLGNGSLDGTLKGGFSLGYEADNDDCDRCSRENGQCGYNTRSRSFACYCRDGDQGCSSDSSTPKRLIIGLSAGAEGLVMFSIIIYCLAKRYSCSEVILNWRPDEGSNQLVDEFMRNYGSIALRLYSYAEIRKITNSFSDKLGHGGFGHVYRGKLSDGREVAVKVLNDSKGNGEDFINEVAAISRTSHVNVVALLGFCCSRSKRALIYEFMPNGSLDKFIGLKESMHLEWKLLYEISMGIAMGLEYLHRGCNTRIVHLDIKPQNILLDADFHPKISDFGLAKLYKNKESVLSTMAARGTVGYIAPEMVFPTFGGISHKSDVYSYGMMVLEMVGLTRKPEIDSQQTSETYFPDWIHERVQLGQEFPLKGVANEEDKESSMKMIYVGLWCIQPNPLERPSITKVVEMLEGSFHSLQIPPKPYLAPSAAMNFSPKSWTTSSLS